MVDREKLSVKEINKSLKNIFIACLFLWTGFSVLAQDKKEIDFIVTNDYLSERNLSMMGGVIPAGYDKGFVDSLENSFVEFYDKGELIQKKFYNKIGALYQTNQYFYNAKKRLEKSIEIDEFMNDSCVVSYEYKDSLDLVVSKIVRNSCDDWTLEFRYKYNNQGEETEKILFENGKLYYRDLIKDVSKNERRVESFDGDGLQSDYVFKRNDDGFTTYESVKKWENVMGESFEISEETEFIYQFDAHGNWTERVKRNFCKEEKKTPKNSDDPIVVTAISFCEPTVKEKLVRKIYYK